MPNYGLIEVFAKAMEEDVEAASLLIDSVVYDAITDEAEALRPEIEALLTANMLERNAVAKRQVAKSYIEAVAEGNYPGDELQQTAEFLAGFDHYALDTFGKAAESEDWMINGRSVRRTVSRDSRGRFVSGIDTRKTKSLESANKLSPRLSNFVVQTPGGFKVDPNNRARLESHQAQWEQANQALRELNSSFGDSKDVFAVVELNGANGRRNINVPLRDGRKGMPEDLDIDPMNEDIIGISLEGATDEATKKVSRFNTLASVGGPTLARFAGTDSGDWQAALGMYGAENKQSKLSQFFNRLRGAGNILEAAPGGQKLAEAAKFVGTYGPEAETVLSPYVRQAAYRYRGTEKEPDLFLMRDFNSQAMNQALAVANSGMGPSEAKQMADRFDTQLDRNGRSDIVTGSTVHRLREAGKSGQGFTADELALKIRSDVAVKHLLDTLPSDPFVAEVSRVAGNVLPSQGVLIDADGDVISQAVGYADDHYLPFDLKNLGSLRGGQYVRTRMQGGLTSEDIYTSVTMGARMATVASSNGVFSIEFDPNFRGARANSDKARQMYDRYIKILDAVDSSKLYTQDISPAKKASLRRQAQSIGGSSEEVNAMYDRLVEQARADVTSLDDDQLQRIEDDVKADIAADPSYRNMTNSQRARLADDMFEERVAEAKEAQVQQLRLNSEGYKVALETLQQQFPYFIRSVSYEPIGGRKGGFLASRGQDTRGGARQRTNAKDQGYVRPGGIRPASVRSGFFNPAGPEGINPAPKRGRSVEAVAEETEPTAEGGAQATSNAPKQPKMPATGAAKIAAESAPYIEEQRKQAVSSLANAAEEVGLTADLDIGSWEQVKGSDVNALKYILTSTPSMMNDLLETDGERVLSLLQNRKAVAAALKDAISRNYGADEFFDDRGSLLGATNLNDAAERYADLAQRIVDLSDLAEPFEPVSQGNTNIKPMAFPEIASLDNAAKFSAYKAANPAVYARAEQIGFTDKGFKPASQVAAEVRERISTLSKLGAASADVRSKIANGSFGVDDKVSERMLNGLSVDAARSAGINTALDLARFNPDSAIATEQRAWSLLTAGRMLEDYAGGGGFPKAEDAVMRKNLAPASWSRQVRVVSKASPLAQVIAKRKQEGKPLTKVK